MVFLKSSSKTKSSKTGVLFVKITHLLYPWTVSLENDDDFYDEYLLILLLLILRKSTFNSSHSLEMIRFW